MNPTDDSGPQRVRQDAHRILHEMDNTPVADMDGSFYQHYAEELRLIVEELVGVRQAARSTDPRS